MKQARKLLELLNELDLFFDEDASVADIKHIVTELLHRFFPHDNLPMPKIVIVNSMRANWLGLCVWKRGDETTKISIQKSIIHDDLTLRKVIAHELIHHWHFLSGTYKNDGHGAVFLKKAAEMNHSLGHDYITPVSDATYDVKVTKPFYVVIEPRLSHPQEFGWTTLIKASPEQKVEVANRISVKDAKVFLSTNKVLLSGSPIKRGGGISVPLRGDATTAQLLHDLYHKGHEVVIPGTHPDSPEIKQATTKIELTRHDGHVIGTIDFAWLKKALKKRGIVTGSSVTVDSLILTFNQHQINNMTARIKE